MEFLVRLPVMTSSFMVILNISCSPLTIWLQYIEYARHISALSLQVRRRRTGLILFAMRSLGGSDHRITATTRQLESMIRLSEAHARMRFSKTVELEDVHEGWTAYAGSNQEQRDGSTDWEDRYGLVGRTMGEWARPDER
jgi:DNA replicative helicase MCM subunit Mcm2 (Cdc46/Mcm family)